MSTILDALRKLQRDRERSRTPGDLQKSVTEDFSFYPARRRRIPWVVLASLLAAVVGFSVAYRYMWRAEPGVPSGLESAATERTPKRPAATKHAPRPAVRKNTAMPASRAGARPETPAVEPRQRPAAPRAAVPPVVAPNSVAEFKRGAPRSLPGPNAANERLVPEVSPIPASPAPHFSRVTRAPVQPAPGAKMLEVEKKFAQGTAGSQKTEPVPPAPAKPRPAASAHAQRRSAPAAPRKAGTASSEPSGTAPPPPKVKAEAVKKLSRQKPSSVASGSAPAVSENPFLDPFEPLTRLQRMPREEAATTVGVREESQPATRANPDSAAAGEDFASHPADEVALRPSGFPAMALLEVRWHPDPRRRRARIDLDGGRNLEVKEGDQVRGARIVRIDPGVVEVEFRDTVERLHLHP